ncbi:MAG: hypothetical protein R3336_10610, partial [Phycisphaeraceae bacterium]|nr:hypothetical protein [Phycisphaeraceae bacterium]
SDPDTRFYVGMTMTDTFQALRAWAKAVGDLQSASRTLVAITAQRLVRRLCTACRSPYQPDPAALRKMNLPAENVDKLFKQSGKVILNDKEQTCPKCMGIGYQGRVAVFEIMALDDDARDLIAAGELDQLRSHLRKQEMMYLQEAALAKVIAGETSISEVTRVFSEKKKQQKAAAKG